jgi:hypothetical protein
MLVEFNRYLALVDKITGAGYNLEKIKKNKEAQKVFFEIQSLLYETYPDKETTHKTLPFEKIESRIVEVLDKSD